MRSIKNIIYKIVMTEDSVGQILSHDITEVIPGKFKVELLKGHIIKEEDISKLLRLEKEHIYIYLK